MIGVWREPAANTLLHLTLQLVGAVIGCAIAARIVRTREVGE